MCYNLLFTTRVPNTTKAMASVNIMFTLREGSKHNISHSIGDETCSLNFSNLTNAISRVHEESNSFITSIVNDEKTQCKFTESSMDNDVESEDETNDDSDETNDNSDETNGTVDKIPPPTKKLKT